MDLNSNTVGIVVPTLGKRTDYLKICLESIRSSSNIFTLIVCPLDADLSGLEGLFDTRVLDPGHGLASAINLGIDSLPSHIDFVNWLGDDDFLEPGAIDKAREEIKKSENIVAVFGQCAYVNSDGEELFINRSGQWAVPLLSFGPDLIPQPGMIFRRRTFNEVGQLSKDFGWAFDFDLLLKFKKRGELKYLNHKLANFRWHPTSLSVGQRSESVNEASRVRVSHLPKYLSLVSPIWEIPVKFFTLRAGTELSKRTMKG